MDLSDYAVIARARGPCAGAALAFAGDDKLVTGWEDGALRIYASARWSTCPTFCPPKGEHLPNLLPTPAS